MIGRLASRNGRKDRMKYPLQIKKSIAYQVLANGDIGGEVAMYCAACV
jgi:hypothetical protein